MLSEQYSICSEECDSSSMSQVCTGDCARMTRQWMVAQAMRLRKQLIEFRNGPPCFDMVGERSDPRGQGRLVRAPSFQVFRSCWGALLALMANAVHGGGNGELRALGMAESSVNMPEELKADEPHVENCENFEAYDFGNVGQHGEIPRVRHAENAHTWTRAADAWMTVGT